MGTNPSASAMHVAFQRIEGWGVELARQFGLIEPPARPLPPSGQSFLPPGNIVLVPASPTSLPRQLPRSSSSGFSATSQPRGQQFLPFPPPQQQRQEEAAAEEDDHSVGTQIFDSQSPPPLSPGHWIPQRGAGPSPETPPRRFAPVRRDSEESEGSSIRHILANQRRRRRRRRRSSDPESSDEELAQRDRENSHSASSRIGLQFPAYSGYAQQLEEEDDDDPLTQEGAAPSQSLSAERSGIGFSFAQSPDREDIDYRGPPSGTSPMHTSPEKEQSQEEATQRLPSPPGSLPPAAQAVPLSARFPIMEPTTNFSSIPPLSRRTMQLPDVKTQELIESVTMSKSFLPDGYVEPSAYLKMIMENKSTLEEFPYSIRIERGTSPTGERIVRLLEAKFDSDGKRVGTIILAEESQSRLMGTLNKAHTWQVPTLYDGLVLDVYYGRLNSAQPVRLRATLYDLLPVMQEEGVYSCQKIPIDRDLILQEGWEIPLCIQKTRNITWGVVGERSSPDNYAEEAEVMYGIATGTPTGRAFLQLLSDSLNSRRQSRQWLLGV